MTVPLSVTELFTPSSSGVLSSGAIPQSPPLGTWLAIELQAAATVGLPTTAWFSGGPELTILAINAVCMAQDDAIISQMAQGSFLDSAASGTVTYQALNGKTITIQVTPDPSNVAQNPTGALGYLDLLIQGVYGISRLPATYATGPLAIANTTTNSIGPYSVGTYHVGNTGNQFNAAATYNNQSSLTIPSSIIPLGGGVVSSVTPGLTTTTIGTLAPHGFAIGDVAFINIPSTSGVYPLSGVFGSVIGVSSTLVFQVAISSSGTYTSGGNVYKCTLATMVADVIGTGSNASPGAVTKTISQNVGVYVSNVVAWSGSNWESNTSAAARARASLAAASPNGPSQAYVYFAETAATLLAAQTPPYTLTNGPVQAQSFATPATGVVTVVAASATPASTVLGANVTPGSASNPVTAATNANPIAITTFSPHGIVGSTGGVSISGVLGNLAANGRYTATVTGASSFTIPVAGSGAYTGGGQVEAGDLGLIDKIIQDNCVPDAVIASTVSANAFPIAITGTVAVPVANVATYQAAVLPTLQAFLQSLPIGGPAPDFAVDYDSVIAALGEAGILSFGTPSYVLSFQNIKVNGGTSNIPFPATTYQALLDPATSISVVGI